MTQIDFKWWNYFYMPEAMAKDIGFTHEGSIFGVPAWIHIESTEQMLACPKVPLLQYYTRIMAATMNFATNFFPDDAVFTTPHTVGREL